MLQHETYLHLSNILVRAGLFKSLDSAFLAAVGASQADLKALAEKLEGVTVSESTGRTPAQEAPAPVKDAAKPVAEAKADAPKPAADAAAKDAVGTVPFTRSTINFPEHYPPALVEWFKSFKADFVARVITPKVLQLVRKPVPGETRKVGLFDDKRWTILAQGKSFLDLDLESAELLAEKLSDPKGRPQFDEWIAKFQATHESAA